MYLSFSFTLSLSIYMYISTCLYNILPFLYFTYDAATNLHKRNKTTTIPEFLDSERKVTHVCVNSYTVLDLLLYCALSM